MAQWCNLLWGLLGALTVAASTLVSWLLDNFPGLREWWDRLAAGAKATLYAAVTLAIGGSLWALGVFGLHCANWPDNMAIWYMILAAVASWFAGGYRHERSKSG